MNKTSANEEKLYLGIDIGGTSIKWGRIRSDGTMLENGQIATEPERGRPCFLEKLLELILQQKEQGIEGVGISTAGIVDTKSGVILGGIQNIPFLERFNLKAALEERAGLSVSILNDVRAAALGEKWLGAGRDCGTFFCMTIGTGIGGCLVIDSHLYEGANFRAGEIGYLDYTDGSHYLETEYSTKGLLENAEEKMGREISGIDFFESVRKRDEAACRVFEDWAERIGKVIANIIVFFDPQKIIVGGGITGQGDYLLDAVRSHTARFLPGEFTGQCPIVLAECRNNAGIIGAVRFLMDSEQM